MGLIAKDSGGGGNFTPVAPGMHLARCYRIVDMGTQKTDFQGRSSTCKRLCCSLKCTAKTRTADLW